MQISNGYNYQDNAATRDAPWVRALFIGVATVFMIVMLVIPLMAVFYEAFKGGWELYLAALVEPEALQAIKLTLLTAAIVLSLIHI